MHIIAAASEATHRWRHAALAALVAVIMSGCAGSAPELSGTAGGTDTEPRRVGVMLLRDVPPVPEAIEQRLNQYQNTRSARLLGWIDDGLLIATRFGDTTQLHRLREPMGAREQLTFFGEQVAQAFVSPGNDSGFIYARDVGGSEFYQLFWYDWASAQHRLLTDGHSRYGEVVWNSAGDAFAYYTTQRNGRSRDIHVQKLDGSIRVVLEEDQGAWSPADFSSDDRRLLVSRYVSINESYLYEIDLGSGARRALLDEGLTAAIGQARYTADGRGVLFTSDLGAEFLRLHYLDLDSGQIEVLTSDIPWDVEGFTLSEDGAVLAFSVNEGGVSRVSVWKRSAASSSWSRGHSPLALPALPNGVLNGLEISPDGEKLALSLSTGTSPNDVWTVSLRERQLLRWTRSEVGGLNSSNFVEPQLIAYDTFDTDGGRRRQIPAFLFQPRGPGPHPVLISIHGGPEGQYRPWFSSTFQYLVGELGMTVIAPNVRGSAGYGKSYLKLDNGRLREDSVKDIGALLDWIGSRGDLDPESVVVMGGSYGGYMVLASLVHYSDRLAAGIESVGISNFVTFLSNTQPYRRDLRRAEYGDERDPDMRAHLLSISPLNQVEKITRPLMISQGANDPRVPASESAQIYQALKASGVPVWYLLAEDEGHGFRKKANRDYNAAVMTLFLKEFALP